MTHHVWIYLISGKSLDVTLPQESARELADVVGKFGSAVIAGYVIDKAAIEAVRIDPPLPEWPV